MSVVSRQVDAGPAVSAAAPVPFATEYVRLTRQEHIRLVMDANYWKSQHQRLVQRAQWREHRYRRVLRELKEQAGQREAALCAELELERAKVRDLRQRLFGRKSERRNARSEKHKSATTERTARSAARHARPWAHVAT